jgi:predicted Zn-dependent protease
MYCSPKITTLLSKNTEEQASKLLSPLIFEFVQIQNLIQQKNLKEAEEKIVSLKNRYPNVAFLDFVWGSILALKGNREAAKTAVIRALATHPDYEEGKSFLQRLEGEGK